MNDQKPQLVSMSSITSAPPGFKMAHARSNSKRTVRSLCKLS